MAAPDTVGSIRTKDELKDDKERACACKVCEENK
jgi:hypothetical protein